MSFFYNIISGLLCADVPFTNCSHKLVILLFFEDILLAENFAYSLSQMSNLVCSQGHDVCVQMRINLGRRNTSMYWRNILDMQSLDRQYCCLHIHLYCFVNVFRLVYCVEMFQWMYFNVADYIHFWRVLASWILLGAVALVFRLRFLCVHLLHVFNCGQFVLEFVFLCFSCIFVSLHYHKFGCQYQYSYFPAKTGFQNDRCVLSWSLNSACSLISLSSVRAICSNDVTLHFIWYVGGKTTTVISCICSNVHYISFYLCYSSTNCLISFLARWHKKLC